MFTKPKLQYVNIVNNILIEIKASNPHFNRFANGFYLFESVGESQLLIAAIKLTSNIIWMQEKEKDTHLRKCPEVFNIDVVIKRSAAM